jgi:hypothetical protein
MNTRNAKLFIAALSISLSFITGNTQAGLVSWNFGATTFGTISSVARSGLPVKTVLGTPPLERVHAQPRDPLLCRWPSDDDRVADAVPVCVGQCHAPRADGHVVVDDRSARIGRFGP